MKIDKEVEKELKEAQAEEDKHRRSFVQTETLKTIFLLYFRIIRKTEVTDLLPSILKGLSRFSHLINLDLLFDLLSTVKELLSREDLSTHVRLNCVLTAFKTLQLQGQTLNVDLKDFYDKLYSLLFSILSSTHTHPSLLSDAIECFQLMFTIRRELVMERLAAFTKRLLIMCLHLPANGTIAVLMVINKILMQYPKIQILLDNDYVSAGIYQMELDDPEHCNAFASTLWEFSLLENHIHPVLSRFSTSVCKQQPLSVNFSPKELLDVYTPNNKEEKVKVKGVEQTRGLSYCYPDFSQPTTHLLQKKLNKAKDDGKSNVVRSWFIQPPPNVVDGSTWFKDLQSRVNPVEEHDLAKHFENCYQGSSGSLLILDE
eukprot:TRINITY_DN2791_c0_g1_i15.p1 TRINITY_DN2791_c0_g1~~TRINITY_DN2791_c0_g1_i15.p1  ORF type:complete len:372 (+),score=79.26 TRINITY_DN2791_c0_g1_i15:737-1852(+)